MAHLALDQHLEELFANYDLSMLKKALKKAAAAKPNKLVELQREMDALVAKYKDVNLTRMRKILKTAHNSVHGSDDESTPSRITPYMRFFKEQSAILKEDMKDASQMERVTEIGRRWNAKKAAAKDTETEDDDTIIPETQIPLSQMLWDEPEEPKEPVKNNKRKKRKA